ncbi:MAG: FxsA family protein [Gammaproteobacteria bacterium]|nr:FxsA family protein [Gammaproteobacteria bacterium]
MKSFQWLLLLFITVPLLELYVLIQLGGLIGAVPTIAFVVLTALVGAKLVQAQGLIALARVRAALDRGETPALPLLEGVFLLVAGALLLTPGFFTDAVGFLALVPRIRQRAIEWLLRRMVPESDGPATGPRRSRTINGEFRRRD